MVGWALQSLESTLTTSGKRCEAPRVSVGADRDCSTKCRAGSFVGLLCAGTRQSLAVLNPRRSLDKDILDDDDLAGPLLICLLFGSCLLLVSAGLFIAPHPPPHPTHARFIVLSHSPARSTLATSTAWPSSAASASTLSST